MGGCNYVVDIMCDGIIYHISFIATTHPSPGSVVLCISASAMARAPSSRMLLKTRLQSRINNAYKVRSIKIHDPTNQPKQRMRPFYLMCHLLERTSTGIVLHRRNLLFPSHLLFLLVFSYLFFSSHLSSLSSY